MVSIFPILPYLPYIQGKLPLKFPRPQAYLQLWHGPVWMSWWSSSLCFCTPCSHAGPALSSTYWRLETVSTFCCLNSKLMGVSWRQSRKWKGENETWVWRMELPVWTVEPASGCQLPWETRHPPQTPQVLNGFNISHKEQNITQNGKMARYWSNWKRQQGEMLAPTQLKMDHVSWMWKSHDKHSF